MSDYQMFEAVVRDVEQITPLVKRFTLVSPTGAPLPAFSGGSHIIVQMQDGEQRYSNAYSLMSSPLDTTSWQIAVRLESPSKGGSRFMHQRVRPGDTLTVSTPNNLFAIEPQARKHLLNRRRHRHYAILIAYSGTGTAAGRLAAALLFSRRRQ